MTFSTQASVNECKVKFREGVMSGRGASAWIGGVTAKLMGGEMLSWSDEAEVTEFLHQNPEIADMYGDPPTASMGVGVPKAGGAHTNGTSILMMVWDRGNHREVVLAGFHSLAGGSHARKLLEATQTAMVS